MAGKARAADVIKMKQAIGMVTFCKGAGRPRDAALIAVCAGFGLRVSDALSLRWRDVVDEAGEPRKLVRLTETKTGKSRLVRVFPFVRDALLDWRDASDNSDVIFPGKSGTLDRRSAWHMVKRLADTMGIQAHVSTHSFRKAFCDFVYANTRDPVETARITGHTNPAQLMRYIGRMAEGEEAVWDRMCKAI